MCFQQILAADLLAHEQQQRLEHTHSQAKGVGWEEDPEGERKSKTEVKIVPL